VISPLTPEQKFAHNTPDRPAEGCWVWRGSLESHGYGQTKIRSKQVLAHRLSWLLHHGSLPGDLCVLHRCDNPPCVRPDHLFLGTRADNFADMVAKGRRNVARGVRSGRHTKPERTARGVGSGKAKLDDDRVIAIRREYAEGATIAEVARRHDISEGGVRHIIRGRAWSHVGGPIFPTPRRAS